MATAIPFTVPNEFSNGAAIVASQHNANWDYVEAYCEQLSDGTNIAADAIVTASIIDNAVTAAKIATGTITATQLASNAVTTVKITDANVTLAKLATAVQNLLVPAGTIAATIKSTADTGWLLLDGASIAGADVLYPSLFPICPASWKSGTTLNLPTMTNKMLEGAGTTTLGASAGSNTVTVAETNLPSHYHTVNPPSTEFTSATEVESPGTVEVVYNTNNYGSPGTDYRGVDQAYDPVTFGMALRDTSDGNTHTHKTTVDIAEFNSGSVGSGTALNVTNAHLAVNFQIKAH